MMSKELEEILDERGSNYGPAKEHFNTLKLMYDIWEKRFVDSLYGDRNDELDRMIEHVVYMICDKLTRSAHDPKHLDNWKDIQGYARLIEKELEND